MNEKMNSRKISDAQREISSQLEHIVERYQQNIYRREPAQYAIQELDRVEKKLSPNQKLILDSCCGVGESSFHLAQQFPDSLVLGVDKSASRLSRKNEFKRNLPENLIYIKGNIIDFWQLLDNPKWHSRMQKICLFYPNPYPKSTDLKKRWHAHPVSKHLFRIPCAIELRTNWRIYFEEFAKVSWLYGRKPDQKSLIDENFPISPFEKKYSLSGHELFSCSILSK